MSKEEITSMKTRILKLALLGALALPLVGCGDATPNCDSTEAKNLVIDITKDELRDQRMASVIDQIKIKVESVRTREHDEKRDTYSCAAELSLKVKVVKILFRLLIPLKVQMTAKSFTLMYLVCS